MASARPQPDDLPERPDPPQARHERRFWGAGPRLVLVSLAFAVVVAELQALFPALMITAHRPVAARDVGWVLLALAAGLWLVVIRQVRIAYDEDRLITSGLFAHVRHPIYSAFIFLDATAVALLAWSWPMLALPFVTYGVYRLLIGGEEARLEREFGSAYADYRERVPALVPRFR
jgi:protein-S-isoprenylcysteine O-methyltransferase Ste14